MKTATKFRLASFGLDMVVVAILMHLIDAAGGGLSLWGLFVIFALASSFSSIFYGEYFLLKYGANKEHGTDE